MRGLSCTAWRETRILGALPMYWACGILVAAFGFAYRFGAFR